MYDSLKNIAKDMLSWITGTVTIGNVIEIIIISICVYYIILWFKTTRAWTLLKGLLIILVVMILATVLNMQVISAIINSITSIGILALVILFQPELRRALEQLGRKRIISEMFSFNDSSKNMHFTDESMMEIIDACFQMGSTKTGALIVMENITALGDYEKTGIPLYARITKELLLQIFEKNTPLHDGAIIIRNDQIVAATCYLPVSANMMISKDLGTRHRAALGISEVSDSLTIIVSEETGKVSVASGGVIDRGLDKDQLRKHLISVQNRPVDNVRGKGIKGIWKRKEKDNNEENTTE